MRIYVNVADIIALFLWGNTLPLPMTVGNDNDNNNDDNDDDDDNADNDDVDDDNRLAIEILSTPENAVHDNPGICEKIQSTDTNTNTDTNANKDTNADVNANSVNTRAAWCKAMPPY